MSARVLTREFLKGSGGRQAPTLYWKKSTRLCNLATQWIKDDSITSLYPTIASMFLVCHPLQKFWDLSIMERYSLAEMHSIHIFFFNFFFSEVQVDAFDLSPKQYFIRLQVGVSVPTQYFLRAPGGRKGTRSRVIERLRCPPDICLFSRSNGAVSWVASPISSEASHIFSVASPVFWVTLG